MGRPILVFGASGHGKVIADAALAAGRRVLGFADDDPEKVGARILEGLTVVAVGADAAVATCRREDAEFVVAIGDNRVRARVFDQLAAAGIAAATVVHPAAVVSRSAEVDGGTVVFAGAIVQAAARIGRNAIVNSAALVEHDNVLEDHVHLSPGVRLGGTVCVGEGTHVGIGATVRNNLRIGRWSVVGAGAVVVADVPDRVMSFGCPARVVRALT